MKRSETVKPPRPFFLLSAERTRASEKKSAWRGATPPPSRQAKEARFTRGKERFALQEIATLVEICLTPQSLRGVGRCAAFTTTMPPMSDL